MPSNALDDIRGQLDACSRGENDIANFGSDATLALMEIGEHETDGVRQMLISALHRRVEHAEKGDRVAHEGYASLRREHDMIERSSTAEVTGYQPLETIYNPLRHAILQERSPVRVEDWHDANAYMLDQYRELIDALPHTQHEVLSNVDHVFRHGGRALVSEALNTILKHDPTSTRARFFLGIVLASMGKTKEALRETREVMKMNDASGTYFNISQWSTLKWGERSAALKKLEQTYAGLHISELHYALGQSYHKFGWCNKAFPHLEEANKWQGYIMKNIPGTRALVENTRAVFTQDFLREAPKGNTSDISVHVMGMPRSGTTLVERLLTAHRNEEGQQDVFSVGEAEYAQAARDLLSMSADRRFPEAFQHVDPAYVSEVADAYLSNLTNFVPAEQQGNMRKIVSKATQDFLSLGMLSMLLPNAKFLHVYRNPMDNGLSMYIRRFTDPYFGYTTDLDAMGMYYEHCYVPMMEHWSKVLSSDQLLHVCYEDLVRDPKTEVPRILEFLELNPSPSCLKHHRHEGFSPTDPRALKPIYTKSIGQWKKYRRFLGPLEQHVSQERRF